MIDFNAPPIPKCANCGRHKGNHKADTMACPWGLSRTFPNFHTDQFYTPAKPPQKRRGRK